MVVADGSSSYVTSSIPVNHEAKLYEHHDHVAAGEIVHEICAQVPMHCVFGERPEMVYVFELSLSLLPQLTFVPGPSIREIYCVMLLKGEEWPRSVLCPKPDTWYVCLAHRSHWYLILLTLPIVTWS